MDAAQVIDLGRESLWIAVKVAAPLLGVALAIGLLVGILQAATSIQEMTLTFVPKIIAVFLGLLFAAPWMLEKISSFTIKILTNIPMYIR